jgi:hypothetical protein
MFVAGTILPGKPVAKLRGAACRSPQAKENHPAGKAPAAPVEDSVTQVAFWGRGFDDKRREQAFPYGFPFAFWAL